jgi:hypothetical protein
MPTKKHRIRLIGRREFVDFPALNLKGVEAKIDTGAYTSSLHCIHIEEKNMEGTPTLFFTVALETANGFENKEYTFTDFSTKNIKNSFGEMEERYIIKTILKIGRKNIRASISLSNRWNMRYQVLIGRKPLQGKFLVDVKRIHLGGIKASIALKQLNQTNL